MGYYGRTTYGYSGQNRFRVALSDSELSQLETARSAEVPDYTPYNYTAPLKGRLVLSVPFRTKTASMCRTAAKMCCARFDPATKEWYLPTGTTNEAKAVDSLNRFRLIAPSMVIDPLAPSTGAVPRSSATSAKPTDLVVGSGSSHSTFCTTNDGFAVTFPNGWMLVLSTGKGNIQTPCTDAQTLECAIWTGTEWMQFESNGKRIRTVTPAEYLSVLAWVASQTAVPGATAAPANPVRPSTNHPCIGECSR